MPRRDKCGVLRRDTWVPPYRKRDVEDAVPYNGTGLYRKILESGRRKPPLFAFQGGRDAFGGDGCRKTEEAGILRDDERRRDAPQNAEREQHNEEGNIMWKKRLVSMAMVLVLAVSLLPTTAWRVQCDRQKRRAEAPDYATYA